MFNVDISFIVPIYNVEDYLEECIESILQQEKELDYEIVLVNDGSTDKSGYIARKYAMQYPNIIRLIEQENRGLSAARNTGLKTATKKYVCFVDSDDMFLGDMMRTITHILQNEELDILLFQAKWGDDERTLGSSIDTPTMKGEELWGLLNEKNCYSTCVPFQILRKDYLLQNHLCFYEGILFEDHPFTFESLLKAERARAVSDQLYYYRVREESITNKKKVDMSKRFYSAEKVFKIVNDVYEERRTLIKSKKVQKSIEKYIDDVFSMSWAFFTRLEYGQIISNWDIIIEMLKYCDLSKRVRYYLLSIVYVVFRKIFGIIRE